MPNSADAIESLARELERQKILMELLECKTFDDYEAFVAKLKAQTEKM